MRNFLNPRWIFLINTLPVCILFFLFYSQFHIIESLLSENEVNVWKNVTLFLAGLGLANVIYAVVKIRLKQNVDIIYCSINLLLHIAYYWFFNSNYSDFLPRAVPRWMELGDYFVYNITFIIPTLGYCLFGAVIIFTSSFKRKSLISSLIYTISIPLAGYLFVTLILPLTRKVNWISNIKGIETISITFTIIAIILFLFFLIRTVYLFFINKSKWLQKYKLLWRILFAFVFPMLGLLINNGILTSEFRVSNNTGVIGNFTDAWFYIILAANALLLCLPDPKNKTVRLLYFAGKCIGFSYVIYFFVVFVPFLPFSLLAIIAFGLGILMLTPIFLFFMQVKILAQDFRELKSHYSTTLLTTVILAGVLFLPSCILISYKLDKSTLSNTLEYVYSPDLNKKYDLNTKRIERCLSEIEDNKTKNWEFLSVGSTRLPYLSSFYQWMVLDNLTLSNSKINDIKQIFFNENKSFHNSERINNDLVSIQDIKTQSTYDETEGVFKTWVDIEILNPTSNTVKEYATTFDLPEGCWITDHYLYIGDRKEAAVLAEKQAALWVFSEIKRVNRDPSLLFYLNGNRISFRVFPFGQNELRKTGIEFIHREPVQLNIDGHIVSLGKLDSTASQASKIIQQNNFDYIPNQAKLNLQQGFRSSYFHFFVDVSELGEDYVDQQIQSISTLLQQYPEQAQHAQVSWVNSTVETEKLPKNWSEKLRQMTYTGGCFLDRAIVKSLVASHHKDSYPVMVYTGPSFQKTFIQTDYHQYQFLYPEMPFFFSSDSSGNVKAHSLDQKTRSNVHGKIDFTVKKPTYIYPMNEQETAYLPINNEASIVLKSDNFEESSDHRMQWQSGLYQAAWSQSTSIHPHQAKKDWLKRVQFSFKSAVMSPITSYICLENEAQKRSMLHKQEQILNGEYQLDANEETVSMSEPSSYFVALLFILLLGYRKYRKNLRSKPLKNLI